MYVRSAPQLWVSFTLFVKYQTQSHLDKPIKPIFIKKLKWTFVFTVHLWSLGHPL